MKRVDALILLFLAPVVVSAQPFLSSGTMTWTNAAEWNASTDPAYKTVYTTTGSAVDVSDPTGLGIGHGIGKPIPSGKGFVYYFDTNDPKNLSMTLAINNVLLPEYYAEVSIGIQGPDSGITHAGTYPAQPSFIAFFQSCQFCTLYELSSGGAGSGVLDVVPYPGVPNTFYVDKATFTFQPFFTPEPATASLLLIALAGLAIRGRRRKVGATLLAAA